LPTVLKIHHHGHNEMWHPVNPTKSFVITGKTH
jgi:hypothetical protein